MNRVFADETMRPTTSGNGRSRIRRGFSLVEILVVLVVLVVGLIAIARLFPQGFATLGFSGDATAASSYEKAMVDYLRNHQENIPAGIVPLSANPADWNSGNPIWYYINPNQPFSALPYNIQGYSGQQPDDPRLSDINYGRHIVGERFMLAPPTTGALGTSDTASLYRALFSPIYSDVAVTPSGGSNYPFAGSLGVQAYSATPIRRVIFEYPPSAQNWVDLGNLQQFGYGIDPQHGLLYLLTTTYDRIFRVDYTYHTTGGAAVQGPPANCLYVPAGNSAGQQYTFDLHNPQPNGAPLGCNYTKVAPGASVDLNSDFLYHQFTQIPVAQGFSNVNPFEFKVYDTVFGLFGFNPSAAALPLPEHQGRGQLMMIDYDVDDWHILREDQSVPLEITDSSGGGGGQYHAIKLAANAIKKIGDSEDTVNFLSGQAASNNTFQYQGLVRYYPDTPSRTGTPGVDLVVVDLQTGLQLDSRTLQRDGNSSNGEIDYDKGVIHLKPSATFVSPVGGSSASLTTAGRLLRIYYRTYNDMGVAPTKPFDRYYRFTAAGAVPAQQYSDTYGAGFLLFPPTDIDGTVAVDYTYVRAVPGPSGSVPKNVSVVGETHQVRIADPCPMPAGTVGPGPDACSTGSQAWIRVSHATQDSSKGANDTGYDAEVTPGTLVITGVRGVSLRSRMAWREGTRWRFREHSTVLTRFDQR